VFVPLANAESPRVLETRNVRLQRVRLGSLALRPV
jgi:hypothetical protein